MPKNAFGVATNADLGAQEGVRCRYEHPPRRKRWCSLSLRTASGEEKILFGVATNTRLGAQVPVRYRYEHPPRIAPPKKPAPPSPPSLIEITRPKSRRDPSRNPPDN